MYCHTEQRRTQRFYIVAIIRHRGTVGAWRNRGYLRVLLIFLSTSLQSSGFTRFLKTFIRLLPKLSATRTLRLCRSLCLRHLREIVCFHLRALPLSVCLLYVLGLIYHFIFRKNLFLYLNFGLSSYNLNEFCFFYYVHELLTLLSLLSLNFILEPFGL